jgi:hypothetical protein
MLKLKILTHNSGEYETTAETFDAVALNEQLNNPDVNTVVIGDLIFSRIDVKVVTKVDEN